MKGGVWNGLFWPLLGCFESSYTIFTELPQLFHPLTVVKESTTSDIEPCESRNTHTNKQTKQNETRGGIDKKKWNRMAFYIFHFIQEQILSRFLLCLSLSLSLFLFEFRNEMVVMGMCLNMFIWIEKCSQIFSDTENRSDIWLVGLTVRTDLGS